MLEQDLWTTSFGGVLTPLIIMGLIIFNIFMICFAFAQKRQRSKLERDILAAENSGSSSPFTAQRSKTHSPQLGKNGRDIILEDASLLKIEQAIRMIKGDVSLEEIKSALDIEASYLQIIKRHHRG